MNEFRTIDGRTLKDPKLMIESVDHGKPYKCKVSFEDGCWNVYVPVRSASTSEATIMRKARKVLKVLGIVVGKGDNTFDYTFIGEYCCVSIFEGLNLDSPVIRPDQVY